MISHVKTLPPVAREDTPELARLRDNVVARDGERVYHETPLTPEMVQASNDFASHRRLAEGAAREGVRPIVTETSALRHAVAQAPGGPIGAATASQLWAAIERLQSELEALRARVDAVDTGPAS